MSEVLRQILQDILVKGFKQIGLSNVSKVDVEFLRRAFRPWSTLHSDEMRYAWTVDFIYIRPQTKVESCCPFPLKIASTGSADLP